MGNEAWSVYGDLTVGEIRAMARKMLTLNQLKPVAEVVRWHKPGEPRTCDVRLLTHDIPPGKLYALPAELVGDDSEVFSGSPGREADLVMLVKVLSRALRKAGTNDALCLRADHYMQRNGLLSALDALRGAGVEIEVNEAVEFERFQAFMASDYLPDQSGETSEADEKAFMAILFHIWMARASLV